MSKKREICKVDELLEKVKTYIDNDEEVEKVKKAYEFAYEKHKGQYRKSGEEYIIHPLNVALILTDIYADISTLQAALMHDVLEDCDCTKEEMEDQFGKEVVFWCRELPNYQRLTFQRKMSI